MFNHSENNVFNSAKEIASDDIQRQKTQATTCAVPVSSENSLLQLIRQHQHQQGWILLVAPPQLPDKGWAEHFQLSLQNVLVIHQKQICNLSATLKQALTSSSCKVVINFAKQLSKQQLDDYHKLALANNIWFYDSEQMQHNLLPH